MTKKALKELYLKRLPKITKAIARNYKPEKIILFGSLAGGKMSEACDIDLFLVKETKKRHSERVREVRDFIPADVPIDIIIYTPKELKEALKIGSYFAEDILSEGKVLYETQKWFKTRKKDRKFSNFKEDCKILDNYYIESKYPLDVPIVYTKREAREALEKAEEIYNFVKEKLNL